MWRILKKIFIIILILLLSIVCIVELVISSRKFEIKYDELTLRYDYSTINDSIPEGKSGIMLISEINGSQKINAPIPGRYIIQDMSSEIYQLIDRNEYINYMWCCDANGVILCFSNYYCSIVLNNRLIGTYNFTYNDGEILLYDNSNVYVSYKCDFMYSLHERATESTTESTTEPIHTTNTIEPEDVFINTQEEPVDILSELILEKGWEIVISLIVTVGSLLFYNGSVFFLIYKKYKKRLREKLFPKEHNWFGNNSPVDVYISAKVYVKGKYQEYNLLDYFRSAMLKTNSCYVILGDAGEGKTFSLSRLALAIIECFSMEKSRKMEYKQINRLVPIMIGYSELTDCHNKAEIIGRIYDTICVASELSKVRKFLYRKGKVTRVIEKYLSQGRFVVMIDGYDEVENIDRRLELSQILESFMNDYDKCNFVLTSRTKIYENERFSNILEDHMLYLSPLSKDKIYRFIQKWDFPEGKSRGDLYQRIINTPQLEDVSSNPLLLTMITYTYCNSNDLSFKSKTDIYRQCCECLLSKWESEKKIRKRLIRFRTINSLEIKIDLLSVFSYELYSLKKPYLHEDELLKLWSEHPKEKSHFHGKARDVLDDILNQSGILESINGNVKFRHRSFYEYFTAIYMAKNGCDINVLYDNAFSKQNILFFYLSIIDSVEIVTAFIADNMQYTKLISNILIERKITDNRVAESAIVSILDDLTYSDLNDIQSICYIAKQYQPFASVIKSKLIKIISTNNDKHIRINVIIGLMMFCDKNLMKKIFAEYVMQIDIEYLVRYSGETISDIAYFIMLLFEDKRDQIVFIEQLAKSYRFEAIYNIYVKSNGNKNIRNLAIMGMLYLSKSPELLNWLCAKHFYNSMSSVDRKESERLCVEYGWVDSRLSKRSLDNLFALVYLCERVLLEGFKPNISLIENKISFLLCYIISNKKKRLFYELINIQNLHMKSVIELEFHWQLLKKRRKKKIVINGIINMTLINRLISIVYVASIVIQMYISLFNYITINELSSDGWLCLNETYRYTAPFVDGKYILVSIALFLVVKLYNYLLKKIDYNYLPILLSFAFSLVIFMVYSTLICNIGYRLLTLLAFLIISLLEVIKHKNNYPSLKEPQYSCVVSYLDNGFSFYNIEVG